MIGSFEPREILLLGPGPSPVSSAVRTAMAAPLLGHLDPDFIALMDNVQQGLRHVFETQNRFTLPLSGTGSAGMEAALSNTIEPGDRVVIGIHGVFGGRMSDLATRLGADVVEVHAEFGQPLDEGDMIRAIEAGPTRLVAFVHAETSTGVLQPVEAVAAAAARTGALLLLDCVTSLGGVPVRLDDWSVDIAFSGTQKCLSVPPGLSPFSLSERALARIGERKQKPPTWYLDVGLLAGYWGEGRQRAYHHTAPVSMIYALAEGLRAVMEEGLEVRHERHAEVAQALYRGLEALGMALLVDPQFRTPMLTSVLIPEGVDDATLRSGMRERHSIEVGGGLGPLQGRILRIGLMGHGARQSSVQRVLTALADELSRAGHTCDAKTALAAANQNGAE